MAPRDVAASKVGSTCRCTGVGTLENFGFGMTPVNIQKLGNLHLDYSSERALPKQRKVTFVISRGCPGGS